MKKSILVLGGAGYIGSHTVVELVNAGYEPIIVDDLSNSQANALKGIEKIVGKRIKFHKGNCGDEQFLRKVFKSEKTIDGCVHFAAFKAVGESIKEPLKYYENNLGTLIVLLKVMQEFGVVNLVFSSSATVYGQPGQLPITENMASQPAASPYGATKIMSERIIEDVVKSGVTLKAVSLRYFNPIGAHASAHIGELPKGVPNNLVPFVTQVAAGIRDKLVIFGKDYNTPDGTTVRDYIHVVDLAQAHVRAFEFLEQKPQSSFYEAFNIGTGVGVSVLEIIKTFEEVAGVKLNYELGERRAGDVEKIFASVDKAKKVLGWQPKLTLRQALLDSWNWQKSLK